MRTRSLTFALPLLYRSGDIELRVATRRHSGRPLWEGNGDRSLKIDVHEGVTPRVVDFALFVGGHEMHKGEVVIRDGQVWCNEGRVLPIIGRRSLTDINIIPGFSRREASLF